jgi:uncharacterized protein
MTGSGVERGERLGEIAIAGERALCDQRGVLYFPELDLLTVSDLHLEKGAAFARRGSLVPPYDTAATLDRLAAVIDEYDPLTVVSLGDSFHDRYGSAQMPEPFRRRLSGLMQGRTWYWVAGNHDPDPPTGVNGETLAELSFGALVFRHQPSGKPAAGEIAGHLHPCARIVQRGRSVRRRCFASDGRRLIMPAFGAYTGSLNVLDRAYAGLFSREAFMAYLLGSQRIYAIAGSMLRPG